MNASIWFKKNSLWLIVATIQDVLLFKLLTFWGVLLTEACYCSRLYGKQCLTIFFMAENTNQWPSTESPLIVDPSNRLREAVRFVIHCAGVDISSLVPVVIFLHKTNRIYFPAWNQVLKHVFYCKSSEFTSFDTRRLLRKGSLN